MDRTTALSLALAGGLLAMVWSSFALARLALRGRSRERSTSTRFTDLDRLRPYPYAKALGWSALFGLASTVFWSALQGSWALLAPTASRWLFWIPIVPAFLLLLLPWVLNLRQRTSDQPSIALEGVSILLTLVVTPLLAIVGILLLVTAFFA